AKVPPLVVRSPATWAAIAKEHAETVRPGGRVPPAVLPPPAPSVTVEVNWSITGFSIFGIGTITVEEGTLFVLADPNDPLNSVAPTLTSVLIGILFQPWVT